ncbi:ABC transporter substrate-binding protein [Martelella endophytica]|uniref:ABC transporter substrate-binding protein n=1 Tax=Martelella endophytica TaxID=1486262 RepID=A0A0D5LQP2_MAREN|nr:ABC transporter substrate-binding protein [Martelella endophytica]AJY46534.1 hypothetical protein TM49_14000 [Martelella endophytica]
MNSKFKGPSLDRRQMLKVSIGGTTALWLGLNGPALAAENVKVGWYGGQDTNARMQKALAIFAERNPDINLEVEFAPFGDFYDRLPVQYSAGTAPDMHRHSMTYLFSYLKRGLLADLSPHVGSTIDVSGLYPGVLEIGTDGGETHAIGNNQIAYAVFYNEQELEKAGVTADLEGMTWDGYHDIAVKIAEAGGNNHYGTSDDGGSMALFEIFLTQRGKSLYQGEELGFEAADLTEWLTYWQKMRDDRACPPSSISAESAGFQNAPMVRGLAGMQAGWCQQLIFYTDLMTTPVGIHSGPVPEGAADNGHLVRALDFWVVPTRSKRIEEGAKVIDFLLNDEEAIKTLGLTLGGPASQKATDILLENSEGANIKVLNYLTDVRKNAPKQTPRWIGGHGELEQLLSRQNQSVGFGQATPEKAAGDFINQSKMILQ